MNSLREIFEAHLDRMTCKFIHHLQVYEKYFSTFRGKEVYVMEVGIGGGGFLQILKKYFGDKAILYGVDLRGDLAYEEPQIKIFQADQRNREDLNKIKNSIPRLDILIDDGGHEPSGQIATFEELFPLLSEDGVYACEDLHQSYHPNYKDNSFVDYLKKLIDDVNLVNPDKTIHFYNTLVIIKKIKLDLFSAVTKGLIG